jgi:hypothetical protein
MGRTDGGENSGPSPESGIDNAIRTLLAQWAEREGIANSLDAVNFLTIFNPDGPWLIVAIEPDDKRPVVTARHFTTPDDMLTFIERYIDHANLYFHPNPHAHTDNRKAKRNEISEVKWLYVDVDPRDGQDFDEERARILATLTTDRPSGVPAPTIVTDSGGGYQAFWRLSDPIPLDQTNETADKAADPNRWLEEMLGGDNCHNIDRILRVPFTYNIPDKRKAKKGRKRTATKLVYFSPDRVTPVNEFGKPTKINSEIEGFGHITADVSVGDVQPVLDLSILDEWNISDHYKIVIAQGKGDKPKEKDNSRSAWLFDAVCYLARQGVPDEIIFALITDKEWGIAESVVERRGGARDYALKQITRAKQFVKDPLLAEMNAKYKFIESIGNKPRIVRENEDGSVYEAFTAADFKQIFSNVRVEPDNPKSPKAGHWWLEHPKRATYRRQVFKPDGDVPADVLNMWKGFDFAPVEGDIEFFRQFMHEIICDGHDNLFDYLENWVADMYQNPGRPAASAIVMRGMQGTGKTFFANAIGRPFGRHYTVGSQSSSLTSNFNKDLEDKVCLLADEALFAGDKRNDSILKGLIGAQSLKIEPKGVDRYDVPNMLHILMATNSDHAVPMGADARRYLVLDVSDKRRQDRAWFADMQKKLDDGGFNALVYHFRNKDIPLDFYEQHPPRTPAWREQVLMTLDRKESWWFAKLESGRLFHNGSGWPDVATLDQFVEDFVNDPLAANSNHKPTETQLGLFLRKFLGRPSTRGTFNGRQCRLFDPMPDLETCRKIWSRHFTDIGFTD